MADCTPEFHAENRSMLYDARGIFCGYTCPKCYDSVKSRYREDIFEDSEYWADEDIEED